MRQVDSKEAYEIVMAGGVVEYPTGDCYYRLVDGQPRFFMGGKDRAPAWVGSSFLGRTLPACSFYYVVQTETFERRSVNTETTFDGRSFTWIAPEGSLRTGNRPVENAGAADKLTTVQRKEVEEKRRRNAPAFAELIQIIDQLAPPPPTKKRRKCTPAEAFAAYLAGQPHWYNEVRHLEDGGFRHNREHHTGTYEIEE